MKLKHKSPSNIVQTTSMVKEKGTGKNIATQKSTPTIEEKPDGPLMMTLVNIQQQLAAQQKSIDQLVGERNQQTQPEEHQKMQQQPVSSDSDWVEVVKNKRKQRKNNDYRSQTIGS